MFSKSALKLLKRSVQIANIWATLPIYWNQGSTHPVVIRTSKLRKFLWFFNIVAHVAHWLFLLTRYINLRILNPTTNSSMKVYTEYVVIAYSLPLIFHATTYMRFHELVNFLNEYLAFNRIVKGTECFKRKEKYLKCITLPLIRFHETIPFL